MKKLLLAISILSALVFSANAWAPNEGGGGGGGGYPPLYCQSAIDYNQGGPTVYMNGPLGVLVRACTYGVSYTYPTPGWFQPADYGWIDGCPSGQTHCWRWRPQ